MDRQLFLTQLEALKTKFDALTPELELTVRDAATDLEGYVVVFNTAIAADGPLGRCGKGGTRISPSLSLAEITMLAKRMALKNAAAGLPLGGAKSGIKADPDAQGFEAKYRKFVRETSPVLREHGGIFGGYGFDIGARPQHVHWALAELGTGKSFTGKPVEFGGTDYDREGIAGLGVAVAAERIVCESGCTSNRPTFAVQGLGAMGSAVARYFTERGAILTHISDPKIGGTFYIPEPLRVHALALLASQDFLSLSELLKEHIRAADCEAVLFTDVEVLFPCALQDVLTAQNAERVQAKLVVEGANGPSSPEAQRLLYHRGVLHIPDFIANPGGIIAAFVEMTTSISAEENIASRAIVQDAKDKTQSLVAANVSEVYATMIQHSVSGVEAGLHLALSRLLRT